MPKRVDNAEPVAIEMTPELKTKFSKVCNGYITLCRQEGLSPLEAYAALSFVTSSLEKFLGTKTYGVYQLGDEKTTT